MVVIRRLIFLYVYIYIYIATLLLISVVCVVIHVRTYIVHARPLQAVVGCNTLVRTHTSEANPTPYMHDRSIHISSPCRYSHAPTSPHPTPTTYHDTSHAHPHLQLVVCCICITNIGSVCRLCELSNCM